MTIETGEAQKKWQPGEGIKNFGRVFYNERITFHAWNREVVDPILEGRASKDSIYGLSDFVRAVDLARDKELVTPEEAAAIFKELKGYMELRKVRESIMNRYSPNFRNVDAYFKNPDSVLSDSGFHFIANTHSINQLVNLETLTGDTVFSGTLSFEGKEFDTADIKAKAAEINPVEYESLPFSAPINQKTDALKRYLQEYFKNRS